MLFAHPITLRLSFREIMRGSAYPGYTTSCSGRQATYTALNYYFSIIW